MKKVVLFVLLISIIAAGAFARVYSNGGVNVEIVDARRHMARVTNTTSEPKTVSLTGMVSFVGMPWRPNMVQVTVELGPRERNKLVTFGRPQNERSFYTNLSNITIRVLNKA